MAKLTKVFRVGAIEGSRFEGIAGVAQEGGVSALRCHYLCHRDARSLPTSDRAFHGVHLHRSSSRLPFSAGMSLAPRWTVPLLLIEQRRR